MKNIQSCAANWQFAACQAARRALLPSPPPGRGRLPGDFNGDGRSDAADAKLFNEKMGLRRSDTGYDRRMDMNGDGIINYADFIILTRHIERDASSQGGGGSGG